MKSTSQEPSVLTEKVGKTQVITLNRPEKLNAADLEMQQRLVDCLKSVRKDNEIRAIVLTGAGRAFSAGGDRSLLQEMASGQLSQQNELAAVHKETIITMLSLEIPVIAAVPGPAVGYAAGLVAMCDTVVIGEEGFLCDPHASFGIGATTAVQIIWPRLTSFNTAKELMMTGRKISAKEAVDIGLASYICPKGKELAKALEIAETYAAIPASGVSANKVAMNKQLLEEAIKQLSVV